GREGGGGVAVGGVDGGRRGVGDGLVADLPVRLRRARRRRHRDRRLGRRDGLRAAGAGAHRGDGRGRGLQAALGPVGGHGPGGPRRRRGDVGPDRPAPGRRRRRAALRRVHDRGRVVAGGHGLLRDGRGRRIRRRRQADHVRRRAPAQHLGRPALRRPPARRVRAHRRGGPPAPRRGRRPAGRRRSGRRGQQRRRPGEWRGVAHALVGERGTVVVERAGRVEGKVAIDTGAGSTPGPGVGAGKATAVVLAREGASVLLADLYPERAEQTRQMISGEGGRAQVLAPDVTKAAGCEAMVRAAVEAFGTLDILVNNVGLAQLGTVVDTTEEAWDRALDVNLRSAFLASKYAIPVMAGKRAGAIVNIASISALRGDGTVAYSAAKGGLIAMTVDMAYSHGRQGIRANAIAP